MGAVIKHIGSNANFSRSDKLVSETNPAMTFGIGANYTFNFSGSQSVSNLLKEDGFDLLQENGDYILL